jgi:hypothetical protein
MGSPPATKLKKRLITWGSMVIVLALAFFGILRLGIYYSSDILFELVKRETNGYYHLSFEAIDIDMWNRAIKLKKVLLKPDTTKDFHAKGITNLYDLELSGLNIDLKSISRIYTERQLVIENVRIINPQIHIIREKNAPDESFSLQTGNLYNQISDYLKVLRIDVFTMENAEVAHFPSELGVGNIDFFVSNLLIDSATSHNQKFYSENIELEIHNQSFKLKDSIHQLSFDRLLLSTADSVLTFENLVLKPITELHSTFDDKHDKIVYDIAIPELRLKGVDYFSAYRNNTLEMEELALIDSRIFLEEQSNSKIDQPVKNSNSLLKQLIAVFDEVKIGKMRFINTNLDVKTDDDYNHNYQHVQSKRADIVLYNVILNSSNYQLNKRKKYFDDVDIIIKDYSSYLPDSIHRIKFDLLQLSSFDSSLVFKNFNISNNGDGGPLDMYLSIDVPLISFDGMNYLDALIGQKLRINEMTLKKPNIIFENPHRKSEQQDFSPDSLYLLIEEYFKMVRVKKLLVDQGAFSINKKISFGQADLLVSNFNIDNQSNSWYNVLDEVELEMQYLVFHDKTIDINARYLKLDRIASRLILDELRIVYQDQNKSATGDLLKLTISGIDLDDISKGNYLGFDSISLFNPQVTIDILKPSEGSLSSDMLGDKFVEVLNGQISGKMHDSTAFSLNNIHTQFTLGALNNIQYGQAKQINLTLPKSNTQLDISDLYLKRSQNLFIKDIELHGIKDSLLHKVELNANIPALTLHGLNQNVFWQQNKLTGDSLIIETPNLNLKLNDINTEGDSQETFEVAFEKIILDKAHLVFSDQSQTAIDMIVTPQLSVTLEGFQYPQKTVLSADHLLYADNVTLNVKNFQPTMINGDSVVISQLYFNKKEALILIDTVSFDKANGSASALFPNTKIVGLDFHAYLNEKSLKLDSIQMTAPHMSVDLHASKLDNKAATNVNPESFDIGYFSSIETEIEFSDSLNSTDYKIHKGNFEVHEFYAQGEFIWNRFFNYVQFAAISGEDVSLPLGDGYQLNIDKYDLEHPKNRVTLDNVNLASDFTADGYSNKLEFQKDWFDVYVHDITFSGVDFDGFLRKQEFQTEKILLDGLNALIYRDKSVPFQSGIVKDLPQGILRKIEAWISIDTLQVKGDITYQEKLPKKKEIAEISFNDLDASLFNITSVDSLAYRPMRLISKGMLADTASFEISVLFDMQDPKDRFTFTGQIERMQLTALNKMLMPVASVKIKDGYAEHIYFNVKADNEIATGEMKFRYDNLKVQILNPETNDLKGLNQGIKTFFANAFIVRHKNPTFIFLRPGKIFLKRDPTRAIFHYWGKALLSGAASSVGIHKSKKAEKRYNRELRDKNR